MKRLMLFPYTFVLMNWAAVAGLYHAVRGTRDIWFRYRLVDRDDLGTPQPTVVGGYQVVQEFQSEAALPQESGVNDPLPHTAAVPLRRGTRAA